MARSTAPLEGAKGSAKKLAILLQTNFWKCWNVQRRTTWLTKIKLAGALLEDTRILLIRRRPWAYPKELYGWALGYDFPEVTEDDYAKKQE